MKAKNIALTMLIAIPVLLLAIGIYVTMNLNNLVTKGVESVGSGITQTNVTLQESDISILSGEGTLKELSIGNPKGFSDSQAFQLGSVNMALDTESLASDTVIIKRLEINAPEIRYEVNESSSNLSQLMENVKQSVTSSNTARQDTGTAKKVIINKLFINNGRISIVVPAANKTLTSELPDLNFSDIGQREGGIEPARAVQIVLAEIATAATAAAKPSLDKLREQMGIKLEGETKGIVNTIKDKAGEVGGQVKEKAGELGDKVKGLFK
jgi:uncharacterized protein involved in outer membrane biogenesis